jgi:hypothetical protein
MMNRRIATLPAILPLLILATQTAGAKLASVGILDRDYLVVTFVEGEVLFTNDGQGAPGPAVKVKNDINWVEDYGALDTRAAANPGNWKITSAGDKSYGTKGRSPSKVFRKAKINGMAQMEWDMKTNDFNYATPLVHTIYLQLPVPLKEGKKYRLAIGGKVDPAKTVTELAFDPLQSRSEAIHVNLAGYPEEPAVKSADLYHWMGDGGARDYKKFEGEKVYLVDVGTGEKREAGTVRFWMKRGQDIWWHDFTASDVWTADFGPAAKPGVYRIAIPGIGCSQDFPVSKTVYADPFKVSVKGFYYMRIGEDERPDIRPIPRRPLFIPGKDPADTKVILTTMQPYHPEFRSFTHGDKWDRADAWDKYAKPGKPENMKAYGGHSDAADWDRHLGHVPIIYDMLYPFILTGGKLADDNIGIAESGNGIPDILDEAGNEVDFWLRLRDGEGYSHGVTCPNDKHTFYQAGPTTVAAWANAANASMLAECFRIANLPALQKQYTGEAVKAYEHASKQADQQLDKKEGTGGPAMRGADYKFTAAAFLFNLTGEAKYEDTVKELSLSTSDTADVIRKEEACQIWGAAAYILSPRPARFPELQERMKRGVIFNAMEKEAGASAKRPSRRASDHDYGYFHTGQWVHRTLLAHRVEQDPARKGLLLEALVREADWGLGRNPLNFIQMTTAATPLAKYRSVENCYTTGHHDGTPGVHPGHTPYLSGDDWGRGMKMARPRWMAEQGYPKYEEWPKGEIYYNTRYVFAHSEFTPQQTMRGKTALYGYLLGVNR